MRFDCKSNKWVNMKLNELVTNVRSKNAGPFWITIDVFCGSDTAYNTLNRLLSTAYVAAIYKQPATAMKRFELPELNVLKFSFPRPVVQGSRYDRDMHGAQYSVLLAELELPGDVGN